MTENQKADPEVVEPGQDPVSTPQEEDRQELTEDQRKKLDEIAAKEIQRRKEEM